MARSASGDPAHVRHAEPVPASPKKRVRITLVVDGHVDSLAVRAQALAGASADIDDIDGMTDEERGTITQSDLDAIAVNAVADLAEAVKLLAFLAAPWRTIADAIPSMDVPTGAVRIDAREVDDTEP